jgi:quinoprotein dehydrogenase-associated probable ABC transporter substrate-binding protein
MGNGGARARRAVVVASLMLLTGSGLVGGFARGAELKSLTVCADPGNMPLSNQKGEGFENKIAEVIGAALGTGVQYYWRPSIERGLMRTTLAEGNCDLWMDMASDTEGAVVLSPLYRSTFVLAYRSDRGIDIKSFDDPALKRLHVGVFQVSAVRQALADHGVVANTVIHYLSHNADLISENQPSFDVQLVADGKLDVAAVWGPMAGYYVSMLHEPLVIKPANLMENEVPLEFDMTLAVPRGRPEIKEAIQGALAQHKEDIRKILVAYGVPLVKCGDCLISGDLPSHGPYQPPKPPVESAAARKKQRDARLAELKKDLARGANADAELANAIVADDLERVRYLASHGAHLDALDGEGYPPLINATRFGFLDVATFLTEHHAPVEQTDRGHWTALMYAAWADNPQLVEILLHHGARIDATDDKGLTPLAIAAQNAKLKAAEALVGAGADVNAPIGEGGYTPLMLASVAGSSDLAGALIAHGANVNAVNLGGVTALMIAAAGNHSRLAELLLKSGADLDARSQDGRTAISIAESNNNEAVLRLLQDAQAHRTRPASS